MHPLHVFAYVIFPDETLLLGCAYIPPSSNLQVYLEHCHVVEQISSQFPDARLCLVGDYNLSSCSSWGYDEECGMTVDCPLSYPAVQVCESFNSLSLRQVNHLPNNHGVFLDLVFTNDFSIETSVAHDLLLDNNFHHVAFVFSISIHTKVEYITPELVIFDYANCDLVSLKSYLSEINWSTVICPADLNSCIESFYNILYTGIELCTPKKRIFSSSFPKWFSKDLKALTFEKKKAHSLFKCSGLVSDYDRFSLLRAQCKSLSNQCYSEYLTKVNCSIQSNPRYFWKYSDESRKVSGYPRFMTFNGVTSSSSQETVDLFAQLFSSVYQSSSLPTPSYTCIDVVDFQTCSFTYSEVFSALSSLPSKFSSGPDKVPPFILKKCASILSNPLTSIFNKSLSSGCFPE